MYQFPIGVLVDCFHTDIRTGVKKAADLGLKGIQVYSTTGEMAPENLSPAARKEFLDLVKSYGMQISAVCGDLGAPGFTDREVNAGRVEKSKRILDLAKEWECNVVTTHIGVVPEDNTCEQYAVMQEACFALSQYADQLNAHFAIETGPEPAARLCAFLDSLNSTGVAVNFDPANLVMVVGDDPVKAVHTLKKYIVHTHAKDGKMLKNLKPEEIYGNVEAEIQKGASFIELPLGQGGVDFKNYLKALEEIGYRGFLTIERETGEQPEADIRHAAQFLLDTMRGE